MTKRTPNSSKISYPHELLELYTPEQTWTQFSVAEGRQLVGLGVVR